MLNDFTGGGQIFLHKIRMFVQVLNRSFTTSLIVTIVILSAISYKPAGQLDWSEAMTYQKALFADSLDDALGGIRMAVNPNSNNYTKIDAFNKHGVYARDIDPRKIIKSHLFKTAYFEVIDFIYIRLLIGLGIIAGIFLLIFVSWSKFGKDLIAEKKKTGTNQILLAKEVSKLLRRANKASSFYIGQMPIVKDSETKHFLVTGSTGSGKTNLIHNLLPQVQAKKQPAIVIDQTGEMIAKYYNPDRGDIIFNPFDTRSKSWDFWTDCNDYEELERFSKILFGFNRKKTGHSTDPFWEQSAEVIFNACVMYQKATGNHSIEQLYSLVTNTSLNSLRLKLSNTPASRYLESDSKTVASSILSILATYSRPIGYLRDNTKENSFSLKKHFQNLDKGSASWLFLATKPSARELTLSLIACLSELAFSQLLNIGIKENRRIWFVIDELSALGKLPALSMLMAEGRKYGACVLSGLQSLNQLYSNYGQYEGSTIFGQFGTNFFFRNNEPAIARMVTNMCGTEIIYRQQKNTSFGAHEFRDGVSYSEHQQQKNLVEYSDLANLATGECFALLPEPEVRIVRLQTPEAKLKDLNVGFIQGCTIAKDTIENQALSVAVEKVNDDQDEDDTTQGQLRSMNNNDNQGKDLDQDVERNINIL
ncbi:MAG: type IV secretion system DNA-binding domain-containing protein [Alphaproteobacteria bacterium]